MSLLAVGVSHQTAPVALLEQFAMDGDDRIKALHELVAGNHVSEAPARSIPVSVCTRLPTRSARWATGCRARPTVPCSRASA